MKYFSKATEEILSRVKESLGKIRPDQVDKLVSDLLRARATDKHVLVIGAGRTGLVGRSFAMRLMHLGYDAYVVGETITPPLGKGDILVAVSGSGSTALVVEAAKAAKKVGARVAAITSFPNSRLAKLASVVVEVPGRTKVSRRTDYFSRQILGVHESLLPLGTLFETNCMIFLDGIVSELMNTLHVLEEDVMRHHANIE